MRGWDAGSADQARRSRGEQDERALRRPLGSSVDRQREDWPEKAERRSEWFSLEAAAAAVQEPGLSDIILALPRAVAVTR